MYVPIILYTGFVPYHSTNFIVILIYAAFCHASNERKKIGVEHKNWIITCMHMIKKNL